MLKKIIKPDARYILELLSPDKKMTAENLEIATGYSSSYIYLVLGWLSREDAINFVETGDGLMVMLNRKE